MDEFLDETLDEKAARKRSHENKLYRFFYKMTIHWLFQFTITIFVLLNTLVLAADTYD